MPYGKQTKYENENLVKAVESVRAGEFSICQASLNFGVSRSTIGDRISGKTSKMYVVKGKTTALPAEMETRIANTAIKASQLGVGVTRKQPFLRTGALVKRMDIKTAFKNSIPGKDWWQGMKRRHPSLSIRKTEKLGSVRCRMMNREKVSNYFTDLGKYLNDLNLMDKPHLIWNCDENGKSFEHTPGQVIAEKGAKNVVSRTSANSTHVTVMAYGNAAGVRMPPLLIAEGKTKRCLFGFNTEAAPQGTMWDFQKNGWIDDRIAERWFRDIFLTNCGTERPQLLIWDGHSSRESLAIIMLALENGIELLCLPPHTTHFLQPLDRTVFNPFNASYDQACSEFLNENKMHQVNKWTFPALLKTAWDTAVTASNIKSRFRACGIFPYNPNAIPESAFLPSNVTECFSEDTEVRPTASVTINTSTSAAVSVVPLEEQSIEPISTSESSQVNLHVTSPRSSIDRLPDESIFTRMDSASTMLVPLEPNFSDPDLHEVVFNAEVVATVDDNGIATLPASEMWNTSIEELFLPALNNSVVSPSFKVKTSKVIPCHHLLTSANVINEKKLVAEKKEQKEREKVMRKQKAQERKKEEKEKQKLMKQMNRN